MYLIDYKNNGGYDNRHLESLCLVGFINFLLKFISLQLVKLGLLKGNLSISTLKLLRLKIYLPSDILNVFIQSIRLCNDPIFFKHLHPILVDQF